jgi:glycosyltransferase involved in cell wall biosynthesis
MENHVYAISTELQRRGHKVSVITSDDLDGNGENTLRRRDVINGVQVYRCSLLFKKTMREYWFLSDATPILSKLRPDVIHAHGYRCLSSCITGYWCRKNRIPMVLTPHGIYPPRSFINHFVKTIYDHSFGNLLLKSSEKIVALTEHNKHLLLKLGAPKDRIMLIPNGVNVDALNKTKQCNEKKLKKECDGPILLYVGRIDWNKGLERVIKALPALRKNFNSIKFLIVGPDYAGYSEILRTLAIETGVHKSVVIVGKVPEKQKFFYYSVADIFVLPAIYEGLSLSLLEAMASSLPVVVTKSGSGGILVDNIHALLMNNGSAQEISSLVSMILTNRRLAERIGKNAFDLVSKEFSWNRIVDKIEGLYSEACNGN